MKNVYSRQLIDQEKNVLFQEINRKSMLARIMLIITLFLFLLFTWGLFFVQYKNVIEYIVQGWLLWFMPLVSLFAYYYFKIAAKLAKEDMRSGVFLLKGIIRPLGLTHRLESFSVDGKIFTNFGFNVKNRKHTYNLKSGDSIELEYSPHTKHIWSLKSI